MREQNNSIILSELSNTQRISIKPGVRGVTIQKEYRKNQLSDWVVSKGIEIPTVVIPSLVKMIGKFQ